MVIKVALLQVLSMNCFGSGTLQLFSTWQPMAGKGSPGKKKPTRQAWHQYWAATESSQEFAELAVLGQFSEQFKTEL